MKNIKLGLIMSVLFTFFVACENKDTTTSNVKIDKPYSGQSIMVIVPTLHAGLIRGPIMEEAIKFEKETGAKIRVVTPSWNETIKKTKESLIDPNINYDIFVVISMWQGNYQLSKNLFIISYNFLL